jgi:FMN-dependent NADH-azoreductase
MPIVLDVNVIPRGELSRTRQLRAAFLEALLEANPGTERISVDLAEEHKHLPVFDEWDVQAKFEMLWGSGELDEKTAERWSRLTAMTDQLHASSLLLISAPMWNFSVPWHLKRWLDAVVQPRLSFEFRPEGFHGLLAGRTAVILTTRDGSYGEGSPFQAFDFQLPYLRAILGFMGYDPIHEIVAEPLAMAGPVVAAEALANACERARQLARSL